MMLSGGVRRMSAAWLFLIILDMPPLFYSITFASEEDPKVIAKVGDWSITSEDLKTSMERSEEGIQAGKERKIEILKELVRVEVFSREARAVGLDRDEKLQKELKEIVDFYLAREYVKRNVADVVGVSKTEVEEYYRKHPEQFQDREKMKVKQIFLFVDPKGSPQESQRAKDLAEDILRRIREGEDFSKLSSEFSSDPLLVKGGGNLGYIARGAMAPEYQEVVFALKVGEISPVLRGESGYSIFKNEGMRPASIKPFEEVWEEVEKMLREEKEDKRFLQLEKNLFDKHQVKIWEERL